MLAEDIKIKDKDTLNEDLKAGDYQQILTLDENKKLNRALRKIDITLVIPMLIAAVLNGIDRANLGLSKVVGLESDLGMSGSDFNVAASIMYPTYLLFMLPSNIILRKVGARIWLSVITVVWGIVNMCMAFTKNKTGLILCRLFLGVAESGLNPGVIMMISLWYPRSKVTPRMAIFFSSFSIGAIIGGPMATGLSKIQNERFKPWGWLFFVDGIITASYGLLMFLLLSDYPDKSWILTDEEKNIIVRQLKNEQSDGGKRKINYERIIDHVKDPLIHTQGMLSFCNSIGMNTILLFAPIIVRQMGFNSSASQAMQAIPGFCALIGTNISRYYPKWFRKYCIGSAANAIFTLIGAIILLSTTNNGGRIFGLCLIGFGACGNLPIGIGWIMCNVGGPTRSSVAGAISAGYGGLGGLCASYIYRNKDEPRYLFGHGMNVFGALLTIILDIVSYYLVITRNRKKNRYPLDISSMTSEEVDNLENMHPRFRYIE